MDGCKNAGRSEMPQLMVKIVGGKQIKYFIDSTKSSTDDHDVTNSLEERSSPLNRVTDGGLNKKSPAQDAASLRPVEHTENLLAALRQIPERRCVTAPCGDRSHSFIHLKTLSTNSMSNPKQLTLMSHNTEAQTEDPEISPETCLLSAVSEELQDLEPHAFQKIEEEVTALDPSNSGSIHQSDLTYLLLKQNIPLKLTTLACVFKSFKNTTDPEQVHYKELLQFIDRALKNEKLQNIEAEIWEASRGSVASTDLGSVRDKGGVAGQRDREMWLQRFEKMEVALQMCDTKNTGCVDRDQAKRLLQNYSLIFDLNLSPLKIHEVTRNTQQEGKVHLASTLQKLKEI